MKSNLKIADNVLDEFMRSDGQGQEGRPNPNLGNAALERQNNPHSITSLFTETANKPKKLEQMREQAINGDYLALACVGAAIYSQGNKPLAFKYFEAAAQLGQGPLAYAIADWIKEETQLKRKYYRLSMVKGYNSFSLQHAWPDPDHTGWIDLQLAMSTRGSTSYPVHIKRFADDNSEKFKELGKLYSLSTLQTALGDVSKAQQLFESYQNELVDEIIVQRIISGDLTETPGHILDALHDEYHESYFSEDLEEKISKRQQVIEETHAPAEITAAKSLAEKNILELTNKFKQLLGKDIGLLEKQGDVLDLIINAGNESLRLKYDSTASKVYTYSESTIRDKQYSALAEKIAHNKEMQSIFLELRAFKKVHDACSVPPASAPSETDSEPGSTTEVKHNNPNTQHLLHIAKTMHEANEEIKAAAAKNHDKSFKEELQLMHWLQYIATFTVIGILPAMLHSYVKHGTVWYGSYQEQHAGRKTMASAKAHSLFENKTKGSTERVAHLPTIHGEINRENKRKSK